MTKILITEDDPFMARMYERVFSFEGYDVVVASNGQESLEKIRETNPTIVLLDVMMPKMNGFEVLEKLKSDPATQNIPVVMLTNLSSEQDAQNAMHKGAVRYIVKSEHDPKQVAELVKEIIAEGA